MSSDTPESTGAVVSSTAAAEFGYTNQRVVAAAATAKVLADVAGSGTEAEGATQAFIQRVAAIAARNENEPETSTPEIRRGGTLREKLVS